MQELVIKAASAVLTWGMVQPSHAAEESEPTLMKKILQVYRKPAFSVLEVIYTKDIPSNVNRFVCLREFISLNIICPPDILKFVLINYLIIIFFNYKNFSINRNNGRIFNNYPTVILVSRNSFYSYYTETNLIFLLPLIRTPNLNFWWTHLLPVIILLIINH